MAGMKPKKPVAKPTPKSKAPVTKPTAKATPKPKKTYRDAASTPGFLFGKGTI